ERVGYPLLELETTFLVHHKFIVLHVIPNDQIRTGVIPKQTTKLLFRTLCNNPELVSVIKFYNDVCFAVFYKLDLSSKVLLQPEQLNKLLIVLKRILDISKQQTGLSFCIRNQKHELPFPKQECRQPISEGYSSALGMSTG